MYQIIIEQPENHAGVNFIFLQNFACENSIHILYDKDPIVMQRVRWLAHHFIFCKCNSADQPIGKGPLKLEWRPDFLRGVMTIRGNWADGSPLTAIPNYARLNRVQPTGYPQAAQPSQVIQPTRPNEPPQVRMDRTASSIVWIKEK